MASKTAGPASTPEDQRTCGEPSADRNVETIRQNFGVEPMDTAPRKNLPAAVGGGSNVDDLLKKYGG